MSDRSYKKDLEGVTDKFEQIATFDENNEDTRKKIIEGVSEFMSTLKEKDDNIIDFRVVCDETNNAPDVIIRNECHMALLVDFADDIPEDETYQFRRFTYIVYR